MKKILCSLFIFIYSINQFPITTYAETTDWPPYPEIYAQAGVLIDASTGAVLYNKNANEKMYPASITKILTTLIALENSSMDEKVTFSHDAVYSLGYDDAHIGMVEGEQLTMIDSLYAIMLASANEVANAVGEHVGGSITEFATMMNERAKKAGAINSNFVNPSGLFNENHYTTCYDMAMITRDAVNNQQFLEIEKNTSYTIGTTNLTSVTRHFINRHKMLFPYNSVYYEGILGGKTGYVDQSGNTLVTFARRNNMTLISVVMKSDSSNVYADTTKLLDYGFNNFKLENISENETAFTFDGPSYHPSYLSVFGDKSSLITMDSSDYVIMPKNSTFTDLTSNIEFIKKENDNTIANIKYYYQDNFIGQTSLKYNSLTTEQSNTGPLVNSSSEVESTRQWTININIWIILMIIICLLIIFFIIKYYKSSLTKKRKRLRNRRSQRKKTKL